MMYKSNSQLYSCWGKYSKQEAVITCPALQLWVQQDRQQLRGVKQDEDRSDHLPRSLTPTGMCPDHVSRWQVLL